MLIQIFILLISVSFMSCTKKDSAPQSPEQITIEKLKSRGQQVYFANCTSCHNPNPKLGGSVGPALAGASLELIRARVTMKSYPAGYKPKRATDVMPALPHLAPEVEALAAYLNNFQ